MSYLQQLRDRLQAYAAHAPPAVSYALSRLSVSLGAADMQNALRYASHVALELEKMQDTSFRSIYDSIVELRRNSIQTAYAEAAQQQSAPKRQTEPSIEVQQLHNTVAQVMQVIYDNNREFSQQFTALSAKLEQFYQYIVSRVNTLEIQLVQTVNTIEGLQTAQYAFKYEKGASANSEAKLQVEKQESKNAVEHYNDSADFGSLEDDYDDEVSGIVQQQSELTDHMLKILSVRKNTPQRVEKGVYMSREWDDMPLARSSSMSQGSDEIHSAKRNGRKIEQIAPYQANTAISALNIDDTVLPQPNKTKVHAKTAKTVPMSSDEPSVDKNASIQAMDDMLQELSSSADPAKKKKRKKVQPADSLAAAGKEPANELPTPKNEEKYTELNPRAAAVQKKTGQREKMAKTEIPTAEAYPKNPRSQAPYYPPKQHESASAAPRKKAK